MTESTLFDAVGFVCFVATGAMLGYVVGSLAAEWLLRRRRRRR